MKHLIDKDALVAGINQRIEDYKSHKIDDSYHDGLIFALEDLRDDFINTLEVIEIGVDLGDSKGDKSTQCIIDTKTLEVKEVDLDKEIDLVEDKYYGFYSLSRADIIDIAKHFFEFGLRSTITEEDCKLIWNIGDDLPYMSEEEFFKELLRRYKAQKGGIA